MIRLITISILAIVFSFSVNLRLWAEEEVEFVESIIIEETYPNEVGEWDLRLSFEYARNDEADINLWTVPMVQLFFGIFERFGASLSLPYLVREEDDEDQNNRIGDIEFGLKYLVMEHGDHNPAIVLGIESGFPTGDEDKELGEGKYEFVPFIAFLKAVGSVVVQGNIGYALERNDESEYALTYGLSCAFPIKAKFNIFAEIDASHNFDEDENKIFLSPGMKYNVTDELSFSVAVPIGVTDDSDDYKFVSQIQYGW